MVILEEAEKPAKEFKPASKKGYLPHDPDRNEKEFRPRTNYDSKKPYTPRQGADQGSRPYTPRSGSGDQTVDLIHQERLQGNLVHLNLIHQNHLMVHKHHQNPILQDLMVTHQDLIMDLDRNIQRIKIVFNKPNNNNIKNPVMGFFFYINFLV